MKNMLVLCFLVLWSVSSFAAVQFAEKANEPAGSCQVTTKLDTFNNPLDDVQAVSVLQDTFTIFTSWNNLRIHNYEYVCTMYDANNKAVYMSSMIMKVTKSNWSSRTTVNPKKDTIMPGEYVIVISLDGEQYINKKIVMLADGKKIWKPASVLLGVGVDNVLHSEQGYFGGSYLYASAGYRLNDYFSAEIKYDFSIAPFPCEEQMISPAITFYTGRIIDDIHFSLSLMYNNNLSLHDSGKIGGKISFFDSAFEEAQFNVSLLPISAIYDLETKSYNFMVEIVSIKARF